MDGWVPLIDRSEITVTEDSVDLLQGDPEKDGTGVSIQRFKGSKPSYIIHGLVGDLGDNFAIDIYEKDMKEFVQKLSKLVEV